MAENFGDNGRFPFGLSRERSHLWAPRARALGHACPASFDWEVVEIFDSTYAHLVWMIESTSRRKKMQVACFRG